VLATSIAFCFLFPSGQSNGLAPIVGGFAAGLILEPVHYRKFRDRGDHSIDELLQPISSFLVPIFFVLMETCDLTTVHADEHSRVSLWL